MRSQRPFSPPEHKFSNNQGQPDKNTDWNKCIHSKISQIGHNWTHWHPIRSQHSAWLDSGRAHSSEVHTEEDRTIKQHNIALFNHIKRQQEGPDEDLQLFWTTEGGKINQCSSTGQCSDDKETVFFLNDTIKEIGDRYQNVLPWKEDITLPNNYFMAKFQWHALQQRMDRDTNLRDRYEGTINDMDKNYFTTANPSCRFSIWYLSHHPMINKQKPDKIQRVTKIALKFMGVSLNDDALLTGPDLLCSLHGLLRFRQ